MSHIQRHAGGCATLLLVGLVACGGGGNDDSAGAGSSSGTAAPPTELLSNPGCETPAQPDATLARLTPTGWTGGASLTNPNAAGAVSSNFFTWPQPAEGERYCDIGNTPAWRLSQGITVSAAGTYRIGWKDNTGLNALPGFRTSPYTVTLTDASGRAVYSAAFDAYRGNGVWEARSADQALAAGTYTLAFTSQGTTGNGTDTLIDDVTVRARP